MQKTLMVSLLIATLVVGMIGAVSAEPTTAHFDKGGCHIANGQGPIQHPHDGLPQYPCHHHTHHHHHAKK